MIYIYIAQIQQTLRIQYPHPLLYKQQLQQSLSQHTLTIFNNGMYNAFMIRKKASEEEKIVRQSQRKHHYVQRYLAKTRPSLIDNYNKRINSFIRRMEEEPIRVNLDPQTKTPKKLIDEELSYEQTANRQDQPKGNRKRASSNITWGQRGGTSMNIDQVEVMGSHYFQFKFKDNEDFKSIFTPLERLERQKNYQIFKEKYGDPTIAFRSIGSQSEYKPYHQFRDRQKDRQIHPPMCYTHKPTKQILANIKNRKSMLSKNKASNNKSNNNIRKSMNQSNLNSLQEDDIVMRRNTGSSISGFNEEGLIGDNMSVGNLSADEGENQQRDKQASHANHEKKQQKPVKLHFKEIMDLEQNITDLKTKKALRDLLYKCGVYRRKNRRAVTDSDVDQFSEFESINK